MFFNPVVMLLIDAPISLYFIIFFFHFVLFLLRPAPVMQFTDDSAMTKSVAESLIEKGDLDLVDLAKRFVKSYYQEPNRGYGAGVVTVSMKRL